RCWVLDARGERRSVPRPERATNRIAGSAIAAQLVAGQGAPVHLVGAVGEAQGTGLRPELGEHEVLAQPAGTVHLDRPVEDHSTVDGVAILMAWISRCAPLLPTVSISQAVLRTSRRTCSTRTRASAIHSP